MTEHVKSRTKAVTPESLIMEMAYGMINTQVLYVAARLGIADLLADGPRSVDDLAAATGAHRPSLLRVLRLLVSNGVFRQIGADCFALNPAAELLRADVPASLKAMAENWGDPSHWQPWGNLLGAVQTGKTAFERVHGASLFEYLAEHPDEAAMFDRYMAASIVRRREAADEAYDFSARKLVVDVGGGQGTFLTSILRANPGLRGLLVDRPSVIPGASEALAAAGVADRCECVEGDFFQSVPPGGDVYVLSNILHDWDDERALTILRNCRRAMSSDSVLLVKEQILPEGGEPHPAKRVDVIMLAITGGQQRTETEFRALFEAAGLSLNGILPVGIAGASIIEAVPA